MKQHISILLILTLVLSSCGKSSNNIIKREKTENEVKNYENLQREQTKLKKERKQIEEKFSPNYKHKTTNIKEQLEKEKEKRTDTETGEQNH